MEQLIEDYRGEIHVEERLDEEWLWDPLETATEQPGSEPTMAVGLP